MKSIARFIFCTACVLLWGGQLSAQYEFELGYRVGMWNGSSKVNNIIDQYNSQRPWLTKKMPHVHFGQGVRFATGLAPTHSHPIGFVFNYTYMRSNVVANGIEPNIGEEGYRRLRMNLGDFLIGSQVQLSSDGKEIIWGLDADLSFFVISTQHATDSKFSKTETDNTLVNETNFGLITYVRYTFYAGRVGLGFSPYLQFPWYRSDVTPVADYFNVNPPTHPKIWPFNFGLTTSIVFSKHHDD